MSPKTNGRLIPASPASAMGIFSASDISSILEEKNSSGSASRVKGSRPSPPPKIERVVEVEGEEGG
eukprot:CAMPEP_0197550344 /NCGR_PEP_ID=MMETSP1320-20131121/3975_1 /TAXON_ID=91990 /ORGANISM="Bolidomonas sp., Strain RCC2347" /LENGTH=65 /DNA_ID=CAMNT_0043110705 /DNA_START=50 /DNA_END=243 /DNA_ORIENTATION=+